MKATIFLRTASVLTLVHAVLHTVGGVFGKPSPGPASVAVAAMQANVFPALGSMRTYWKFYRGMGLGVTIFLTVEGIVFWLLANAAREGGRWMRPVLVVFCAGYLLFAVNSFEYFFLMPVVVEIVIAACLGAAAWTIKQSTRGVAVND